MTEEKKPRSILDRWAAEEASLDAADARRRAEMEASNEPPPGMADWEIAEWRRQRGLPPEAKPAPRDDADEADDEE